MEKISYISQASVFVLMFYYICLVPIMILILNYWLTKLSYINLMVIVAFYATCLIIALCEMAMKF